MGLHIAFLIITVVMFSIIGILQLTYENDGYGCDWTDYWIMYCLAMMYAIGNIIYIFL